jgi:hypothetical protein
MGELTSPRSTMTFSPESTTSMEDPFDAVSLLSFCIVVVCKSRELRGDEIGCQYSIGSMMRFPGRSLHVRT